MNISRVIPDFQETDIDTTIEKLKSILQERNPVLMVGAGSSNLVDYPRWSELIDELNSLVPSLNKNDGEDLLEYADRIKNQLEDEGNIEKYYDFLKGRFKPNPTKHFTDFHCSLLNLGFTGIVTTNYDIVLERAASNNGDWCEPIDLCSLDDKYNIFKYLRSISRSEERTIILHLHGCFNNPKKIILTQKDYLYAYGEITTDEKNGEIIEEKVKPGRILHTFHRKVIWSLLATHTLVFIGFSMNDDFFMKMLEIVKEDFNLDSEPMHFAVMSDRDKDRTSKNLKSKGVFPLFYPHSDDHLGLQYLISKIEHLIEKDSDPHVDINTQNHNREESLMVRNTLNDSSTDKESEENDLDQFDYTVSQTDLPTLDEINQKMMEL